MPTYDVVCIDCGAVFQPLEKSPLWWQAKQRDKKGLLDALPIRGEKCGCVKKEEKSDAPFRVFGYDDMCTDFSFSYHNFIQAAKAYLECVRGGDVVFVHGVSTRVQERLRDMAFAS